MKKALILFLLAVSCVSAHAQLRVDFGSYAFGATASYGTSSNYTNLGAGLVVHKFFGDHFRAAVYGNYFFENKKVSMVDFGADFHYVFPLTKQMGVYPLVGLGYTNVKIKDVITPPEGVLVDLGDDYGDEEEGRIHANIGAGYEYYLTPSFKVFGEVKYHYAKDFDRPVFTVGAAVVW